MMQPDIITPKEWIKALHAINTQLRDFKQYLESQDISTHNIEYISSWTEMYCNTVNAHLENPKCTYTDVSEFVFGDVLTFEDYALELLKMVPPIQEVITIKRTNPRGNIILESIFDITAEILEKQMIAHQHCTRMQLLPPDTPKSDLSETPQSINTSLRYQVQEMEEKLDQATKEMKNDIGTMENNLTSKLQTAIKDAILQLVPDATEQTNELNKQIIEGTRTADKLSGDIKVATATVNRLQKQATSISENAEKATEKATKAYLDAKSHMDIAKQTLDASIEEARKTGLTQPPSPTTIEKSNVPPYSKSYPDDYEINGNRVIIRVKKFNEDTTPIICNSNEELLTAYELLSHVAVQYGILLTSLDLMQKWNIQYDETPPTCPYVIQDFKDKETHDKAYNTMSLALATKLKTGIIFGPNYAAAQLTISPYRVDGYKMLYQLLQNAHPQLMRNKATRPSKPTFDGDINRYLNKYKNWIMYQVTRAKPHFYDDDEIADDIIFAIKNSAWANQLAKGLDYVENKLDLWKAHDNTEFPVNLQLQFIGQTIMSYYIERNINPFATRPQARYMNTRGRSRSASRSQKQPSRQRSTSIPSDSVACKVCGGYHKQETVGCPHLYRHIKVQEYVSKAAPETIDRHLHDIDNERRRRSKSRDDSSRQSHRSVSSSRSQRE
jgi:hypothetical protein